MRIIEKMAEKSKDNFEKRGVTIAFLGDSVTQGCFELYIKENGEIETFFDKSSAYHTYIQEIFNVLFPSVPVNIINAGISGGTAPHGLSRIERDVLKYNPDLTVVCFGLNDSSGGMENLSSYKESLYKIFIELKKIDSEIIFMTPNMMNTKISCHINNKEIKNVAENCMKIQNDGVLDSFIKGAKEICNELGVAVCDCYEKWNNLYKNGVDITELLSNKINHPTRQMNKLFAYSLVETMFK